MSAISPDSPNRSSRWVAWWAHHESILVLAVAILTVADFITHVSPLSSGWGTVLDSLWLVIIVNHLRMISHHAYICVECMIRVPENAQQQAARKKFLLWLHHQLTTMRTIIRVSLVSFVVVTTGSFIFRDPGYLRAVVSMPVDVLFLMCLGSAWQHRPLVIYCPWCKWDGGGKHEHVPTPDPSMIKSV